MTEKRFKERYIEKDNKVFDTWKNMAISRELDRYSLSHMISHLNVLGEIIDTKIEQGRYCFRKYNELKEENEQLKHEINYLEDRLDDCVCFKKENKDLKKENLELSQKILKGLFEDESDELRKENKRLKEELEWCRMTVDGLKG